MLELLQNLAKHEGIETHLVGWMVTIIVAASTLLYKGVWARIKQLDIELTSVRSELDRLVGAHNAMAIMCGGHEAVVERRQNPDRQTIIGYVPTPIEDDDL